jgi:hypothetical protein
MSRFRALVGFFTWLALLSFLLDAGCSRPTEFSDAGGGAPADQGQAPFREAEGKGPADSNNTAVSLASDKSPKTEVSLPFRDPDNLPAGTLLTVRLKNPLSAEDPEARSPFEGVIDEPITVDGKVLVPSGANVAGWVQSARSSREKGSAFLRVTLDSIDIAGKDLRIQTSSLFARGNGASHSSAMQAITLEKGRRLTFRLTEPAYVVQLTLPSR